MRLLLILSATSALAVAAGCGSRDSSVQTADDVRRSTHEHRTAVEASNRNLLFENRRPYAASQREDTEQAAGATSDLSSTTGAAAGPGQSPARLSSMRCPMLLSGTSVRALSLPNGAALDFVAPAALVPELRSRVEHLARVYNGTEGIGGETPVFAESPAMNYVATVQQTMRGARLELRTEVTSDLQRLRQEVQEHADVMEDTNMCPMLDGEGSTAPE